MSGFDDIDAAMRAADREAGLDRPEPALLKEAARLPLNDFGNGRRLVVHFGEDLMFVPRVGWFTWDGKQWAKDPDQLAVRAKGQRLAELIEAEIPHLALPEGEVRLLGIAGDTRAKVRAIEAVPEKNRSAEQTAELTDARTTLAKIGAIEKRLSERRSRHRSFATSAGNSNRIGNALLEAAVPMAVPLEALDAHPLDVNTASGVLRFSVDRGGEGASPVADVALIPHERDQRMTKMIPAAYDPDATCPRFDAFLAEVQPDAEVRRFLQRWFGLSMSGVPIQRLVFFYGMGANGKSVLVDLIMRILADYAATVRIESLTGTNRRGGGDATPDLIPLIGARGARTSEPDQGTRLQEGLIKELTGGEPILVRALHSDFVEIQPHFKLTMSGNHKPEIRGTDDGIWRRVTLVDWPVQIPEARRNPRLAEELFDEAPGILNWLVEGLLSYLEIGLAPPASVTAATEEYRRESDPLGEFLATCCVVTGAETDVIKAAELVKAFAFYLLERGETPWKDAHHVAAAVGQGRPLAAPGDRAAVHEDQGLGHAIRGASVRRTRSSGASTTRQGIATAGPRARTWCGPRMPRGGISDGHGTGDPDRGGGPRGRDGLGGHSCPERGLSRSPASSSPRRPKSIRLPGSRARA
jgi:putative DNA primase/helicase